MFDKKVRVLWIGIVLVHIMSWTACHEPAEEIVLPPDEILIELLCDLHNAEAAMSRVQGSDQDTVAMELRVRIADSHGITTEQMDTWLESLQKSPEHMVVVYDSVIARLERQVMQDK